MEQLYRRQLGENYDKMKGYLKLEQNTIDSLIDEYLLQGFISQIGLHAGVKLIEHQIREEVLSIPQLGGEFNQQSYNTYLRARGVTGAQLEVETGQQLRVNQLSNFFRDTAIVTEPELKAVHTEQNTTYQFNYLKLESAKFEDNVDLSKEEEIAKHFEDNIESYRKPRSVKFEYVEFRPADFEEGVVIQDEDLNLLYKQQRHEFREPTTYHVRQIVAYKNRDKEKSKLE
jgi:hypothetical protein